MANSFDESSLFAVGLLGSHLKAKKRATTESTENLNQNNTLKRKVTRRQRSEEKASASSVKTESNHTETASTSTANKLKRKQTNKSHQQVDTFEISSDEEAPIEKKSKNCVASRTRSKAPNPDKKSKSPIHTSASGIYLH